MKFGTIAIGLFSLFLLYNSDVYASTASDVRHTIQYIISHPVQSTISVCKIGAEGLVASYACYLAYLKACKCFGYFRNRSVKLEVESLKRPFKTTLICAGLVFVAYECGNGLISDIKELR